MKLKTFKGGTHPQERKDPTKDLVIKHVMPSTNTVVIPVTQGGAPNTPLVAVGDVVARGQKIAESSQFMSAPVHASIAGTVKKIEPRLTIGNTDRLCIVIEGDNSDRTSFMPILDPFSCSHDAAVQRVKEAGITGMGGASFPTHVKLSPPPGKKITTVLANAAECEPYLTIDERTMLEEPEKIIDGIAIEMQITGAADGIICLEDNKFDLVPILEKAIQKSSNGKHIFIQLLKTKYPQGGEKMLVKAAVGREIPAGGLPADAGCLIQNVGTLKAISEAFREGKPLIDRGLTISGGACATPCNIVVPVGTLVGDLIPEVVQLEKNIAKIISGGPMMGIAMQNANFPLQKNSSGVLFLTRQETAVYEETPCISCGACAQVCPCGLVPVLMNRALIAGDIAESKSFGLMDCMECGTCAYVCPAKIKLVQRFKVGKLRVREEMQKQKERATAAAAKAQKGDK